MTCFVFGTAMAVGAQVPAIAQDTPNVQAENASQGLQPLYYVVSADEMSKKFPDLKTAMDRSRGSDTSTMLRRGVELVYLNSRCDPAEPVTYSMTSLARAGIDKPYQDFQEWRAANPGIKLYDPETMARRQAMVDEIRTKLTATWFPRQRDCDPIPILLSIGQYESLAIDENDAGNPLVGARINDGSLFATLTENNPYAQSYLEQDPGVNFRQKFAVNRFGNAPDAISAAFMYGNGDKLVIFNGQGLSVYYMGDFEVNRSLSGAAFDAQFDALKAAKLREGLTIIAAVLSEGKAVKINLPGQ